MARVGRIVSDFNNVVVAVTIPSHLMWRFRVGLWLIKVGAWVATVSLKEERA